MADPAECWPKYVKSVTLPPRKIFSYLPPVKDAIGLRTLGIYSIPCECGKVKAVNPSNSASKSTIDIQDWHNPTNQR
jgi:hypothetical protein